MKKEEKRYGLLKVILLFILIAIALSWLIPVGQFSGTELVKDGSLVRIGITDFFALVYTAIEFSIDKLILLIVIGGFYGVLTRTKAYDNITSNIAKKMDNKVAVVVFSVLIAVLTSLFTQAFVVIIFIPFIVSILNKMKLDKITIFATTFGSILVGLLGATYGTEGLILFSRYYTAENFDPNSTILIRAGILLIGLVLFNFFTLSHMSKKAKKNESVEMITCEEVDDKKKSILPIAIVGGLLTLIAILAFVNWSGLNVTIFEKFHDTIMNIKIGSDFYIFQNILGSSMVDQPFGSWDAFSMTAILGLFTIIIGLCYRFKFEEFVNSFINGAKKMIMPSVIMVLAYVVMAIVYKSGYVATMVNGLLSLTDSFNLATMSLSLFISNLFHANLDFTGFIMGSYLATEYVGQLNPLYVMLSSLFGFASFFVPTSIILGIGLTSLDIKYKDWLKYIWKFLLGILICLLVIFILMTVI